MPNQEFRTLTGYTRQRSEELSPAMEDYLEMIYRIEAVDSYVRMHTLAQRLNVTPPSASRMVAKLAAQGYVDFRPYGIIKLSQKGLDAGIYLLKRHDVLQRFFCWLNKTDDVLDLVEKIEHFIDADTIENMNSIVKGSQF